MFTFEKAKFAGEAGFDNAKFTGYTGFNDVQFTGEGRFDNAQFAGEARFDNAHFTGEARFGNAQFAGDTIFGDANFTGLATFDNAQFTGEARFGNAQFAGYTRFNNAQFAGYTIFGDANFTGLATFDNAQFTGEARFEKAKFAGGASFDNAQFNRDALFYDAQCNVYAGFNDARFAGEANFQRAKFTGEARFDFAQFDKGALFDNAKFEKATALGPLVADRLDLNGAVFSRGIDIRVAAVTISCADAIWEAAGTLRLRYATVILERTTFTEPSFITGFDRPFRVMRHEVDQATGEARWVQKELDDQHISERVSTGNVKFLDAWMPIHHRCEVWTPLSYRSPMSIYRGASSLERGYWISSAWKAAASLTIPHGECSPGGRGRQCGGGAAARALSKNEYGEPPHLSFAVGRRFDPGSLRTR